MKIKVKADGYTHATEKAAKFGFKPLGNSYTVHDKVYKFKVVSIKKELI